MIFHPDADDCSQVRQGRQYAGPRLVLVLVTLAAGGHTPPSLAQPRQQLPGAVASLVLPSLVVARLRRVLALVLLSRTNPGVGITASQHNRHTSDVWSAAVINKTQSRQQNNRGVTGPGEYFYFDILFNRLYQLWSGNLVGGYKVQQSIFGDW